MVSLHLCGFPKKGQCICTVLVDVLVFHPWYIIALYPMFLKSTMTVNRIKMLHIQWFFSAEEDKTEDTEHLHWYKQQKYTYKYSAQET